MTESLKDTDPMPCGIYKHVPMRDVPAIHLDAIADKEHVMQTWPSLRAYIDHNREVIDRELEDPRFRRGRKPADEFAILLGEGDE